MGEDIAVFMVEALALLKKDWSKNTRAERNISEHTFSESGIGGSKRLDQAWTGNAAQLLRFNFRFLSRLL